MPKKVRKYISLTSNYEVVSHMPKRGKGRRTHLGHIWQDFESPILVALMTTQAGRVYWTVFVSGIDGPPFHRTGVVPVTKTEQLPLSIKKFHHMEGEQLSKTERAINRAFAELAKNWIDEYQPKVFY